MICVVVSSFLTRTEATAEEDQGEVNLEIQRPA